VCYFNLVIMNWQLQILNVPNEIYSNLYTKCTQLEAIDHNNDQFEESIKKKKVNASY